jgi:hypothetical protein
MFNKCRAVIAPRGSPGVRHSASAGAVSIFRLNFAVAMPASEDAKLFAAECLRGLVHIEVHRVPLGDDFSILYNNDSPRAAAVGLSVEALLDDGIECFLFSLCKFAHRLLIAHGPISRVEIRARNVRRDLRQVLNRIVGCANR